MWMLSLNVIMVASEAVIVWKWPHPVILLIPPSFPQRRPNVIHCPAWLRRRKTEKFNRSNKSGRG